MRPYVYFYCEICALPLMTLFHNWGCVVPRHIIQSMLLGTCVLCPSLHTTRNKVDMAAAPDYLVLRIV